jgi:hypothetical protein
MHQAKVRYGRPKGSGLDDRAQLAAVAALLAANPKLKPTTAIRSLGVEDPSDIRRLRDKFRSEQGSLLADAHRTARTNGPQSVRVSHPLNENAPAPVVHRVTASPLLAMLALPPPAPKPAAPPVPPAAAATSPFAWYEMGFAALNAAIENQAVLAQCFMHLPAVAMTVRAQLAMNAVAVAAYQRGGRPAFARR